MNIFRKQGFAWVAAIVMIAAAVGIGRTKAAAPSPSPVPTQSAPAGQENFLYVYDEAEVLSDGTERTLSQRNQRIRTDMDVVIAVVTCNYDRDDLYNYALDRAEAIGLSGYDFIVVLDISGDNYWLVQGADLVGWFSDDDCAAYATDYMEQSFAKGNYDAAVLSLTEALEKWYYDNY